MPRFAVLRHDSPSGLHWDFLLEMGPALKTWAMPRPPEPGVEMTCDALSDHRPMYLDYEGPVSRGRGSVRRWDRGTFRVDHQKERELVVELAGQKLTGRLILSRLPEEPGRWRLLLLAR